MPHHPGRPPRASRAGRRFSLLIVPLLAVVLLTPVWAQLPPLPPTPGAPAPDVNVTAAQTNRMVERGACATFQVTVQNAGQLELPVADEVTVRISSPPQGWTLNPDPSGTFELMPGESESLRVGLCPSTDVARGAEGRVTLTAVLQSRAPLTEPVDDSVLLTARVEEGGFLGIGDRVPTFVIWVALAAVGLLLATAVLARRRPGAAVVLECREPSKEVPPGRGTSFPVRIGNEGRSRDVVSLTTSPVPRGWDTFLPVVDVPLEPGEEQTVWISVKSPEGANPGDHIAVKVFARSSAAGGAQASLDLLTTVSASGSESAWGGGISTGGSDDDDASVYGPEGGGAKPVAVKRRRA